MKSKLICLLIPFVFCLKGLNSQTIPLRWVDNHWGNIKVGLTAGQSTDYLSAKTFMCSDGSFMATMLIRDSVQIGKNILETHTGWRLLILKYSKYGNLLWDYSISSPLITGYYPEHSFLGENNSLYLAMEFDSLIKLGKDTTIVYKKFDLGITNAAVCKITSEGNLGWAKIFGSTWINMGHCQTGGCLVRNYGGIKLVWDGITLPFGTVLHFGPQGQLLHRYDSLSTSFKNVVSDKDSNIFFRAETSGNFYIGGDTIKGTNSKADGIYGCVSHQTHKLLWRYHIKDKAGMSGMQHFQAAVDKFGNSYFIDHFAGDSINIDGNYFSFPYNAGSYYALVQFDKSGNFKKFLYDSLPEPNDYQRMRVGLNADSTKLLLYVSFNKSFTLPGVGKISDPYGNILFVLDIQNNLKCEKYYRTFASVGFDYSINPWNPTAYAVSYPMGMVGNIKCDTINVLNTGKANQAIFYFDEKNVLGFSRMYDNSFVSVFPNPCQTMLQVSGTKINNIEMMDMLGRTLNVSFSINKEEIDMSPLKAGVYFIRINNAQTFKVVKQ